MNKVSKFPKIPVRVSTTQVWSSSVALRLKCIVSTCSMSLTLAQGEGISVITITSNPKSKWPILCQILGTLCYTPVYSVSQGMKEKLKSTHTALGTMQIIYGVVGIVLGVLMRRSWYWNNITDSGVAFWVGGMAIVIGIVTILAAKFPSSCLLAFALLLNVVNAALAITAVVLCSIDLAMGNYPYCRDYYDTTPSPEQMKNEEICRNYKKINQIILGGLYILMIVMSVLQLCVTISFCVLTGKTLCTKTEDAEMVEDPELNKPLLEDANVIAAH